MSFSITCPVCGKRDLGEFRFGNEDRGPVIGQNNLSREDYLSRVVFQKTLAGAQKEWWCHVEGCGTWFSIARDTLTNREVKEGECA